MAARTSQQINSASSTLVIKVTGPVTETTTGSMQLQLKPSTLMSAALTITTGGKTIPVDEVLGSQAVYLKIPGVSQLTGKPWLAISFAELSGKLGASFEQLLQSMQNGDPFDQTQLLATAKDVRAAGTQTIDGVRTTRYTGSYSASSARAALSPSLRRLLGPGLNALTGDVRFTVWIDAQHHVRRTVEVEHVNGATVSSTVNITAINQPVHITMPPASQVAPLSRRMLSGGGPSGGVL
jgi:LppX_LprAFG lipoprotein